jgi:hypothetical protein
MGLKIWDFDRPRRGAAEEVLQVSLQESRRKIHQLENMQKVIDDMLLREKKQFQRLHFALKNAHDDAAYCRTLAKMVDQLSEKQG